MPLILRNPHSVLATLETRPRDVTEIRVPANAGDAWARVAQLAKQHGIRNQPTSRGSDRPDRGGGGGKGRPGPSDDGGRAGTAEAHVKERVPLTAEELFSGAREKADGKGLWLALDSLTDPHNVGAIFRSAAFFGVQGILLTEERSAPLSSTVYDVASGGVEHVPVATQVNLQRAFEIAKDNGLWILGTSEHARDDLASIQRDRPWLLVIGNEEKGMRRLTEESCDVLCRIPPAGKVTSLNAAVAAGICIARLSGARI